MDKLTSFRGDSYDYRDKRKRDDDRRESAERDNYRRTSSSDYPNKKRDMGVDDALELNLQLQVTIKDLNEELKRYKDEIKHLRGVVDDHRAENASLKYEVVMMKDQVKALQQQIKDERQQRESVFKENSYVITKLEEELYKFRVPRLPPQLPIPSPLGIPPMIPINSIHPIHPINPMNPMNPMNSIPHAPLPLKVKEIIAREAHRCLWLSHTAVSLDALESILGGSAQVETIFVNPKTSSVFILFHTIEQAIEAVANIHTTITNIGTKIRSNLVHNSIWIGNLFADETSLRHLCESCGEVESIRMMFPTNCAFVTFADTLSAVIACCELDGVILGSLPLAVNFKWYNARESITSSAATQVSSLPVSNVLYVGDLDFDITKEDFHILFGTYGNVLDVWTPKENDYAFVTFGTVEEAVVAKYHLQGKRMGAKHVKINYRKNKNPLDAKEFLKQVSETLTMTTKPKLEEDGLRQYASKYGRIKTVNRVPGGSEWIVRMETVEEAIVVRSHLNARKIGDVHFTVDYVVIKIKESP